MTKFVGYEIAAEKIFEVLPPKHTLANSTITAVNLGAGLIAGNALLPNHVHLRLFSMCSRLCLSLRADCQ